MKSRNTDRVRVVVAGATGRMGSAMSQGLAERAEVDLVGGFGSSASDAEIDGLLAKADVLLEFTAAQAAPQLLRRAIAAGVRPVSGTSGIPEHELDRVDAEARAKGIPATWASNFHISAVLMIHFARIAARYMDAVEIVEAYHRGKADSPSGTSLALARAIRESHGSDLEDAVPRHESLAGARGAVTGGVRIHSVRLPGVIGRNDVMFGAPDALLTIRHEDMGYRGYLANVVRAVEEVMRTDRVGLTRGLEEVLGLAS